jgi:ABC-type uncharacterized transport system ATPase subunit/ABC-type uncharacterized transport system permease subunit
MTATDPGRAALDSTAGTPRAAALELRHITKRFGDFVADDDVSLRVEYGEVHALVGENGAGKSTLMNVCFGILQPTSGEIWVDGDQVVMASPTTARHHGLGMVHQHFKLVPSLTVAENVFLGAEPTSRGMLDRRRMVRELSEVSERYGLLVDPKAHVVDLSAGQRQRVEVLKALYFDARVLILDEPTAVLTPQETDALFGVLRDLVGDDRAVILITHKLREVKAVSDRFSVLRRGKCVATDVTRDFTEHDIATLMVGREVSLSRTTPPPLSRVDAPSVLRCENLVVLDRDGRPVVDNVSLDLRCGEITGIAGVEGNGQTELVEALAGLRSAATGSVRLAGRDIATASPAQRRDLGLAHVPEDRLAAGVSGAATVQDNLTGGYLSSNLFHRGVLRAKAASQWAAELIARYDIRGAAPATAVRNLSGGNIQKVVLARELESNPAVLLAAQPTRGVDIGATEFVHRQLREARDRGAAVLLVSADLGELLAVSDRIVVMYRGQTVAEFAPAEELVPRIGLAMAGAAEDQDRLAPLREEPVDAADSGQPAALVAEASRRRHEVSLPEQSDAKVRRSPAEQWQAFVASLSQPLVAVLVALVIGIICISAIGDNPVTAYNSFLFGSFKSELAFSGLIAQVIPLLLVAVSVYVSFRAGVINIGAEGQLYVGGLAGICVVLAFPGLPGWLLVLAAFVVGGIGGALWAYVPGLLDAYLGVDILVTSLMFNYIGISLTSYLVSGVLKDPQAGTAATKQIPDSAHLTTILGFGGANIGIFVGLLALLVMGFVILRSRWGMQARFVGENRVFARYLGINVRAKVVQVVLTSGFIAGMAGVVASLGTQFRFNQTFSPGFGFIGLTVALLGRLNPLGIALAALLYGVLRAGGQIMQLDTGVPLSLVTILEGVIVILMTATIVRRRAARTGGLPTSPTDALLLSSANQGESETR